MNKRDQIVQSVAPLFFQNGFRGVTVDEIAHTLGISKKTLYKYFESKENLIAETKKFVDSIFFEIYENISNQHKNPVDILYGFVNTVEKEFGFTQLAKNFAEAKYYCPELEDDFVNAYRMTARKIIKRFIADTHKYGYVDEKINANTILLMLGNMYNHVSTYIDNPSSFEYKATLNEFIYTTAKVIFNEKGLLELKNRKDVKNN